MFGGEQKAAASGSYRVLARKYRPQTFDDLIGQDAHGAHLAQRIRDQAAFRKPGF